MLRNYIKTAIRSLVKQRVYTSINILGLAVSITACILIVLYVKHETSYDKFYADSDRIYKMVLERKYPNHVTYFSPIPHSFAPAVQRDYPEVESTLIMQGPNQNVAISYRPLEGETKSFEEDFFLFADSSFFSFFDMNLIKGDKRTALSAADQVIVSRSSARKYFGEEDPMGKTLSGDFGEFKVTGIFEDQPDNSHMRYDFIGSIDLSRLLKTLNYTGFDSQTYIKLKPGASASALEAKFPGMVDNYAAAEIETKLGKSWIDYKKEGNGYRYFLQPLTEIHLDPTNLEFTMSPSGNKKYVYSLSLIAVLILVIACINFMNLATARSSERAREVGVRKVMGSLKGNLIAQFLTEAFILSVIGTLLAVVGAYLLLPSFNDLIAKQLQLTLNAEMILGLLGFALFVGLLAGLYPAFVLSSFNPVVVMKGNFISSSKGKWLRNGLVVFQFMISIILIVGTLVVGNQMSFMQNKQLGFEKDQVLMVKRAFGLQKKTNTFVEEVKTIPGVNAAACSGSMIGNRDDVFGQQFKAAGFDEILTVKAMVLDDEFPEMIGLHLQDGKFFSKETSDSLSVILNETAVKTIGLTNPIGHKIYNSDPPGNNGQAGGLYFTVIGVVKNFHFQSLRDEITPLVIYNKELFGSQATLNYVAIRIESGRFKEVIGKVESAWKELAPDQPFQYEFLDDNLSQGYAEEQRSGVLFRVFSGLAVIIACVGLFGLSAYTASLRTKEIGVRKVLGASVGGVVVLLSKDFTRLVIIAFVLATPFSWWMMEQWLSGFAYRIPVGVEAFVIAGLLALGIAWLTVSYQSIKAAIVNPVKSLRSQ
ncbi:MAG: FtsX-like permease family protein [Cyclobacteriaceae bacterium]|nr:FtsX-like permease family protein [Cyclobacteriaceae bacterium]